MSDIVGRLRACGVRLGDSECLPWTEAEKERIRQSIAAADLQSKIYWNRIKRTTRRALEDKP